MTNNVVLTAAAILPEDLINDNIPGYIDKLLAGEDPAVIRTICRTAEIGNKGQRFYAKISKFNDAKEIKGGWHLKNFGTVH